MRGAVKGRVSKSVTCKLQIYAKCDFWRTVFNKELEFSEVKKDKRKKRQRSIGGMGIEHGGGYEGDEREVSEKCTILFLKFGFLTVICV